MFLVEHPDLEVPADSTVIIRYMSIAKFISLLSASGLYFAPASELDDGFEGAIPESLVVPPDSLQGLTDEQIRIRGRAEGLQRSATMSCWHELTEESDALWRIYAEKEESVAVVSNVDRLRRSLAQPDRISIGRVRYIDYSSFEGPAENRLFYPFAYKRTCFEHEREIRAIRTIPFDFVALLDGNTPVDTYSAVGVEVQVDLGVLVSRIVVSPYAKDWLLVAVEQIVRRLGFDFDVEFSALR